MSLRHVSSNPFSTTDGKKGPFFSVLASWMLCLFVLINKISVLYLEISVRDQCCFTPAPASELGSELRLPVHINLTSPLVDLRTQAFTLVLKLSLRQPRFPEKNSVARWKQDRLCLFV